MTNNNTKTESADAWFKQGVLYDQEGSLENALECYQKSIVIDPDFVPPWYNMGAIFLEDLSEYQKAKK